MTLERIKATSLWSKSLAQVDNDPNEQKREELRSSFIKFRENIVHLVGQIAVTLPDLTRHDISHLDALWETASLIAGDQYPLNPLEGFVLGGAILLHDSALSYEAYDEGIEGIRRTAIWKDAYSAAKDLEKNQGDDHLNHVADFAALRQLHANQASKLCDKTWTIPGRQEPFYLLENQTLRRHLGELIGKIAASHHWDIERVSTELPSQFNVISTFPREWRIDPVKIACLLRCADAAHIDNEYT